MSSIFKCTSPTEKMTHDMFELINKFEEIEKLINKRKGRLSSLAIIHLESCAMWANKAICKESE